MNLDNDCECAPYRNILRELCSKEKTEQIHNKHGESGILVYLERSTKLTPDKILESMHYEGTNNTTITTDHQALMVCKNIYTDTNQTDIPKKECTVYYRLEDLFSVTNCTRKYRPQFDGKTGMLTQFKL